MDTSTVILIALASALVAALISRVYSLGKIHRKLNYMLDALEDKETNFHFSEEKFWHRRFNRTLNRIHILYDRERQEIAEQEQYYGQMLDQVRTGIVVIDLKKEEFKKSQEEFFIFLGKILYLYGNLFKIKIKNF